MAVSVNTSINMDSHTEGIVAASKKQVLPDLPDELLLQIIKSVPSQRDLHSLCLVNHRFHTLADPLLYHSIYFDEPQHHIVFSESLNHRPRRGSLIQNVRLEYPESELAEIMSLRDGSYRIDNFSDAISRMSNLENLEISVPESMLHGIGTLFNGPFDLACLKTCSLFYQREDGGYWDLQENIHIFSHPTLETLTIKRAKLDRRGFESVEQPSETSLTVLHLVECDINDEALSELLLFPDALKHITMTQLEVPEPPLEESSDDTEDYILALRSADHSLETISIDFPTLTSENPLKLRAFESLVSLEIRHHQLFGQSRLHSIGLPPFLERLKFLNRVDEDEALLDLLCYTMEQKDIVARRLREMLVAEGEDEGGISPKLKEVCKDLEDFRITTF